MRKRALAFAAILLFAAVAVVYAESPQSITFAASSVTVGDTWIESASYTSDLTFALHDSFRDLDPVSRSTSVEREKSVKVVETTANGRIGTIEVTYTAVRSDGINLMSTFAGRTYRVALKGNKVESVTYANGTIPPEAETTFVLWDNNRHDQVRAMNRTFGGRTVAIGETLLAKDPSELIDADSGMTVTNFSMKLASISADGQSATFALRLTLANKVKKAKGAPPEAADPFDTSSMTLDLAGSLLATTGSRITGIALTGPVTVGGSKESADGVKGAGGAAKRAMTVSGSGTAVLVSSYRY